MFKIKLSTVLSIAAGAGVVVTGFLAARGGKKAVEMEIDSFNSKLAEKKQVFYGADLSLDDWKEATDRVIEEAADEASKECSTKKWKCYIPAIISGVVTLGCGAYAKRLDTKEIIKLTGALGVATSQLNRVLRDFGAYREAVVDEVGPEKEAEIRTKAAEGLVKSSLSGMEEKKYVWMIDWVNGKPIFFEATPMQVDHALTAINRKLARMRDDTLTIDEPTVSDFLYEVGHPELVNNGTDTACWDVDECCELQSWWVDFETIPYGRQDFTDGQSEYYQIMPTPYPNGFPYNAMINAERAGTM